MSRVEALSSQADGREHALRRTLELYPWLVAVIVLPLLIAQLRTWWRPTPDAAAYLSIARSIATAGPTNVTRFGSKHLYYAVGYPILISPAFKLPGDPFLRIGLIHLAMASLLLLGIYVWATPVIGRPGGAMVVLLVGVNVAFWQHYRDTLSELAMMTWFVWAGVALRGAMSSKNFATALAWALAGLLLVLASGLTRQAGCLVVSGLVLAGGLAWWRGSGRPLRVMWAALLTGLPVAIVILLMARRDAAMAAMDPQRSLTYMNQFHNTSISPIAQIVEGIRLRTCEIGRLLVPGAWKVYADRRVWLAPAMLLHVPVVIGVTFAWWRLARRIADPLLWTVPAYMALYIVWPYDQGVRFLLPLLPIFWVCIWSLLGAWQPRRVATIALALAVLHLGVSLAYNSRELFVRRQVERRTWDEVLALAHEAHATGEGDGWKSRVVTCGLSENVELEWSLATDRFAKSCDHGKPIAPGVTAVLHPLSNAPPAGFAVWLRAGELALSTRTEPSPQTEPDDEPAFAVPMDHADHD